MAPAFVEGMRRTIKEYVYDDSHLVSKVIGKIAAVTQQKREIIAYVGLAVVAVYMMFGYCAGVVCNLICVASPIASSLKAVETQEKVEVMKWFSYWTVFGAFSLLECFSTGIMRYFPLYWLLKTALFVWLSTPVTNGALLCYAHVLNPLSKKLPQARGAGGGGAPATPKRK